MNIKRYCTAKSRLFWWLYISGSNNLFFCSLHHLRSFHTNFTNVIFLPQTSAFNRIHMPCRGRNSTKCRRSGSVPVYLNVYDLTSINGCAYWFGLGVYHSGVQVHGVEYAFGSHEQSTSGIYEGEPKKCEGFTFRKQILIGWTEMSLPEIRGFMKELARDYKGNSYKLITRNCNHFCNDACIRLTGNPIPSWINRLARIGFLCDCLIPASVSSCKVGKEGDNACDEVMREKLMTCSSSFGSSSSSPSSSEKSTVASTPVYLTRSFGTRSFDPPCSPFVRDYYSSTSC